VRFSEPDLARYGNVFHRVGDEYLWAGRLLMGPVPLERFLTDPRVEVYVLTTPRGDQGLLELDFRVENECEISLFGVARDLVSTGAGRWLMNHALAIAWSHPIERFWLHTCTLDHPNALGFYLRTGFVPYERKVEVYDDPRFLGLTRRDAAPHVPIL
jgi:GNAT superfamily N-acetyltransferase